MKNKRILILSLLIVFLLSIIGTMIYIYIPKKTKQKCNEISKIILQNKSACKTCPNGLKEILLEKRNEIWYVNKDFKAKENDVSRLLSTIEYMEIKRPVGVLERENILKRMDVQRTTVKLFCNEKLFKKILVGGNASDGLGTYMIIEDSLESEPYVFHLPGHNGFLNSRFSCEEVNWRDKTIWDLTYGEIKKIEIIYPDSISSFDIEKNGDEYRFMQKTEKDTTINWENIKSYFNNFGWNELHMSCEKILADNKNFSTNEIKQRKPFFEISITLTNDSIINLKGIRKNSSERGRTQNSEYDTERFYGVIKNDLLLIQYQKFNEILKRNNDFYIQ